MKQRKLIKHECEICGEKDSKILHLHHLLERTLPNTNNDEMNLGILCPNCHSKVHSGAIEIIGVFPSTKPPNGRILIFKIDEMSNVEGIEKPYYIPKPKAMKVNNG